MARAYRRPLVKTHPITGRRGLHIGRHAFAVDGGLDSAEGDALLEELLRFAVGNPRRTWYHQWEIGDLIIWDNRRMLHRACHACPGSGEPRMFHGNRVGGDESEAALNADALEPGFAQLQQELRWIDTHPELVERELRLREEFDRQHAVMTAAAAL